MAYTQTQLTNLENAIATGALRVESDGQVVVYRTLEDMIRVRDTMRAELGVSSTGATGKRIWKPNVSTGLEYGSE